MSEAPRNSKRNERDTPTWRRFEKLVSRIEAALSPQGATVTSPDTLLDKVTKQPREVDATIRYKVGTTDILIIVECRERRRIQDTVWIEQLATKQRDVGAAKCIAVSAAGFTRAATKKAHNLGIELRHAKLMDEAAIKAIAPLRTWFYSYQLGRVDPSYCVPGHEDIDDELDRLISEEIGRKHSLDDRILTHKKSGHRISIREYITDTINIGFDGLPQEKRAAFAKTGEKKIMSWAGEGDYSIQTSRGIYDMFSIAFEVTFTNFVDYSMSASAVVDYADAAKSLVRGYEFALASSMGATGTLTIHQDLLTSTKVVSVTSGERMVRFKIKR